MPGEGLAHVPSLVAHRNDSTLYLLRDAARPKRAAGDADAGDAVPSAAGVNAAELAVWLATGVVASYGIGLGGMAHHLSLGFFDLSGSARHGAFNWALPAVFAAAVAPPLLLHHVVRLPAAPLLAQRFIVGSSTLVDARLVGGSALFGVGWALSGFCPGPSGVGLVTGQPQYVASTLGMFLGMAAVHAWRARARSGVVVSLAQWAHTALWLAVPLVLALNGPRLFPLEPVRRTDWPLWRSVVGGLLIGLASAALLLFNGRIMGISGIWADGLAPRPLGDKLPNTFFTLGIFMGGALLYWTVPDALAYPTYAGMHPLWLILLGGVLVGVGVSLANGCTSGHGVGGLPRFSIRSTAAVATFMATTMAAVTALGVLSRSVAV